jgi:YHS domain-containing protein
MKTTKVMKATSTQVKDPVCGMMVDQESALHAERDGRTSYFCGESCRKQWLAMPATAKSKDQPRGKSL